MLMLYLIRMEKVSCTGGAVMFCVSAMFLERVWKLQLL